MAKLSATRTETHNDKAYRTKKKTQIIVAEKDAHPGEQDSQRRYRSAAHGATIPKTQTKKRSVINSIELS